MNQHFYLMIALIFFFLSFNTIPMYSARELPSKQGKKMKEKCVSCRGEVDVKIYSIESQESVTEMKGFDSFNKLIMGLEEDNSCEGGLDEEDCLKRRDMLEAHLDYIYTQKHKP